MPLVQSLLWLLLHNIKCNLQSIIKGKLEVQCITLCMCIESLLRQSEDFNSDCYSIVRYNNNNNHNNTYKKTNNKVIATLVSSQACDIIRTLGQRLVVAMKWASHQNAGLYIKTDTCFLNSPIEQPWSAVKNHTSLGSDVLIYSNSYSALVPKSYLMCATLFTLTNLNSYYIHKYE